MLTRRRLLQATAASAAFAALPRSFAHTQTEPLTIWGPPVTPTVLLAVAAEQGKARHIRPFNVKSWQSPDQLRAGLLNKSIQLSIVPSYVSANLRAQGQAVKLFNIMTNGLLSIMSKGKPLTQFTELAGQKLVMPFKNDMPDLVLQLLAKKHQLDLRPLITYTATPPEAVALFLQKDFPNALLPEPLATVAMLKGKQQNLEIRQSFAVSNLWNQSFGTQHGIPQAGLMVTEAMLQTEGEFLTALQADLEQAVGWVAKNPQAAAKLAAQYMPAPVPALEKSFANSTLTAVKASAMQEEILAFMIALYELNPKIVGGKAPDLSLLA